MMNNAITQTMKNRATATRFVLVQGTHRRLRQRGDTQYAKVLDWGSITFAYFGRSPCLKREFNGNPPWIIGKFNNTLT